MSLPVGGGGVAFLSPVGGGFSTPPQLPSFFRQLIGVGLLLLFLLLVVGVGLGLAVLRLLVVRLGGILGHRRQGRDQGDDCNEKRFFHEILLMGVSNPR